ncbi:MAG: hypothetical protein GY807_17700 [Gammaproteobacteria bacterium]|nr:hypothetical protein [Gammaproteobacteria bacterium]
MEDIGKDHAILLICAVRGAGDSILNPRNPSDIPVDVSLPSNMGAYVFCGDFHTCAVSTDGDTWCWGKVTSVKLA